MREDLAAGRDRFVAEQDNARSDVTRRVVQADRRPLRYRLFLGGKQTEAGVDAVGRRVQVGCENEIAAFDRVLRDAIARKVERAAFTRDALFGRPVLGVDRTDARWLA